VRSGSFAQFFFTFNSSSDRRKLPSGGEKNVRERRRGKRRGKRSKEQLKRSGRKGKDFWPLAIGRKGRWQPSEGYWLSATVPVGISLC